MEELLSKLERNPDSHKGDNGYLGIIGGSREFNGAPALAAEAALRAGCDLTKILTAEGSRDVVASFSENLVVDSYGVGCFDGGSLECARELEEWSDAIVMGPGLGNVDQNSIREFVSSAKVPLVIDADAIQPALKSEIGEVILTPHRGEVKAIEEEFGSVEEFVEEKRAFVVAKGPIDKIYSPEGVFENDTGTAAMTVGGTGDVLSGIIGSLIAQGLEIGEAARLGCWISGKAGESAAEEYRNGMLATDLIEEIPAIIR